MDAVANVREGAAEHHKVVILGSGFSGLGMAIRLKERGENDFVVFEKEAGVGGTWRVNHYPGCACDVQSHLYSFSFEQNPNWSRMFARQPEIKAYLEGCARKYGIVPHIRFDTEITALHWDDARKVWRIADKQGRSYTAEVVVSGMGGLSTPAYPNIAGLERFQGKSFHSQQWDHDYDLAGKRVAVIGTGASAIQFVPQIQPKVARLDLYQRTPPWIIPKPDRRITALEQRLFRRLPAVQKAFRGAIYSMLEGRVLGFALHPKVMELPRLVALRYIKRQIKDPELREKVTPDYMFGCKRVLISDDYYPAVAQPNVDVITNGIREVRARSIVDGEGREREIDAIIFGTGFRATDPVPAGTIFGRGGRDIAEVWKEGPEAYKGATVAGFPNLFFLMGPNTGLGHSSMVYMIESQIAYVLDAIEHMKHRGWRSLEPKPEAQAAYNARIQGKAQGTVWNTGGCSSWYLHPVSGKNTSLWPGFTWQFRRQTRRFDPEAYRADADAVTAGQVLPLRTREGAA